jgi:hypothetical protein
MAEIDGISAAIADIEQNAPPDDPGAQAVRRLFFSVGVEVSLKLTTSTLI